MPPSRTAILLVLVALGCSPVVAQQESDNRVRMVVGYDSGEWSKKMFPVLAKLRERGYDIVYVNIESEKGRPFLETFRRTPDEKTPLFLVYIGHEAWEKASGVTDARTLADWYNAVARGERTKGYEQPTQQREYLQEPKDKPLYYLRRTLSPPSCGMTWCFSHRTEILEYVDANGNVVGRPNQ